MLQLRLRLVQRMRLVQLRLVPGQMLQRLRMWRVVLWL
jgi:hypothetical protein